MAYGTYTLDWSTADVGPTFEYPLGMTLDTVNKPAGAAGALTWPLDMGPNASTEVKLNVVIGPGGGQITFWRWAQGEQGWDGLRFFVDAAQAGFYSNVTTWAQVTHNLTEGAHTLIWRYTSDGGIQVGENRARLALLQITNMQDPPVQSVVESRTINFEDDVIPAVLVGASTDWAVSTVDPISGTKSLKAGNTGAPSSEAKFLIGHQPDGNAVVSLDWKVSSEVADVFDVYHGNKRILAASGNTPVSGTLHAIVGGGDAGLGLVVRYTKDNSFDQASDAAWVDNIVLHRHGAGPLVPGAFAVERLIGTGTAPMLMTAPKSPGVAVLLNVHATPGGTGFGCVIDVSGGGGTWTRLARSAPQGSFEPTSEVWIGTGLTSRTFAVSAKKASDNAAVTPAWVAVVIGGADVAAITTAVETVQPAAGELSSDLVTAPARSLVVGTAAWGDFSGVTWFTRVSPTRWGRAVHSGNAIDGWLRHGTVTRPMPTGGDAQTFGTSPGTYEANAIMVVVPPAIPLEEEPPPGSTFAVWDGDGLEIPVDVLGVWDGGQVDSVDVLGVWDGSAVADIQ